ncbi:MAG: AtpZ/AtpI family protein [Propionibacteriaceae bacterium]|jgi:F0F1-type ATP synthase assembly protein I|nr:AtpZ/AtpI family protein [Propionibacteriaceae bacterium]
MDCRYGNQRGFGLNDQGQGITVVSLLLAGLLLYGGAGWLLDSWLGTRLFTPFGLILGSALSIYVIVKKMGGVKS